MESLNPATGEVLERFDEDDEVAVDEKQIGRASCRERVYTKV